MFGRKDNNRRHKRKDENNRKAGDNYPEERAREKEMMRIDLIIISIICQAFVIKK